MKTTQHTPGPWQTYTGNTRDCVEEVKTGKLVAIVYEGVDSAPCTNNATQRANAHLIAAAPELLGALELALNLCAENAPENLSEMPWPQIRAAIAKARGE